jgi:hypothetical protein
MHGRAPRLWWRRRQGTSSTVRYKRNPWPRPADAQDTRSGGQRTADALAELARRALEGGRLPQAGGVRPQLLVTVELDSLLSRSGGVGGQVGWAGPLAPEACRRLACDGTVTRVVVSRQPTPQPHPDHGPAEPCQGDDETVAAGDRHGAAGLEARLRAAAILLPPVLGGAPSQPLEVGRATRVVQPANAPPLPSATAAVGSLPVTGRWPGAKPTTCGTGCMGARPTWPTSPCCVEPTTGRSRRAAGNWPADPMGAAPPPHPTDDSVPPDRIPAEHPGHRARYLHGAQPALDHHAR